MRVLLRKTSNRFYYQKTGLWGSNPDKGFNFGAIHRALDFAETTSPNDVEIALVFDNTRHISSVPVKAVHAELARIR
jgi:hypothetical protein